MGAEDIGYNDKKKKKKKTKKKKRRRLHFPFVFFPFTWTFFAYSISCGFLLLVSILFFLLSSPFLSVVHYHTLPVTLLDPGIQSHLA
jgi:hypothetical protein